MYKLEQQISYLLEEFGDQIIILGVEQSILDEIKKTRNRINEISSGNKNLDSSFQLDTKYMTNQDIEIAENIKKGNTSTFEKIYSKLEFSRNNIAITLPTTGKLIFDREDFIGKIDWDTAITMKNMGKRLPSKEEYKDLIEFIGNINFIKILKFSFESSYYWTLNEIDNKRAYIQNLTSKGQTIGFKKEALRARYIQE